MEELNTAELTHNNILQIQETVNSSNIISSSHKETNQSLFSISSCFEKYKLVITKLIPYESFIHRFFLIDLFSLLIFFDQSFSNINPIIKIMYFVILALVDLNLIYRLYKGNALYSNATLIYKIAFSYITMFCIPTSDLFTYINFLLFHTSLMIMLLILVSLIIITQNTSYLYKDWKRYSLSFINIVILIYLFCSFTTKIYNNIILFWLSNSIFIAISLHAFHCFVIKKTLNISILINMTYIIFSSFFIITFDKFFITNELKNKN